eukprot:CAMPEP_0183421416 /NCGR_PEP_ID=MMETSP0370-20130417/27082_1 /TAXON_ID=268820 /ORGANISM="Peridinium aciculiferum, Strain PAER-2" /LENGTH=151 /DNA_ID=CAMNT_0025605399 /DNA_START=1108 /DNA_END=1563 /DNA_ORIENTATION=-
MAEVHLPPGPGAALLGPRRAVAKLLSDPQCEPLRVGVVVVGDKLVDMLIHKAPLVEEGREPPEGKQADRSDQAFRVLGGGVRPGCDLERICSQVVDRQIKRLGLLPRRVVVPECQPLFRDVGVGLHHCEGVHGRRAECLPTMALDGLYMFS